MHNQPENEQAIRDLIQQSDSRLEDAAQDSSSRAFNTGCSVGLLPAIIFVILAFILSKNSWIVTGFIAALMMLALLAFANLSAYISRNNTVKRIYSDEVLPNIEQKLDQWDLSRENFDQIAEEILPLGATLRLFINDTLD